MVPLNWNDESVDKMFSYISKADGEEHDTVVFTSGYEFDRTNRRSVEQVMIVLMNKYSIKPENAPEVDRSLLVPLNDVDSYITAPNANDKVVKAVNDRAEREAQSKYTYIPHAREFIDRLQYIQNSSFVRYIESKKRGINLKEEAAMEFSNPISVILAIFFILAFISSLMSSLKGW